MQRAQAAKEREQRIRKEETEKAQAEEAARIRKEEAAEQAEERAAMQREVEEKKASATTLAHQLQNSIDEQE